MVKDLSQPRAAPHKVPDKIDNELPVAGGVNFQTTVHHQIRQITRYDGSQIIPQYLVKEYHGLLIINCTVLSLPTDCTLRDTTMVSL